MRLTLLTSKLVCTLEGAFLLFVPTDTTSTLLDTDAVELHSLSFDGRPVSKVS